MEINIQRKNIIMLEINKYGDRFWFNKNRNLHRLDGPATERNDGTKTWYKNGKKHRLDGPAVENMLMVINFGIKRVNYID